MGAQPKQGELVAHEPNAPALGESAAVIQMIERLAVNPAVDVDKVLQLMEMRNRVAAQASQAAFDTALAAMQPEIPAIEERGGIKNNAGKVQSTYALWEDVNEVLKPILARHDFSLTFKVKNAPGLVSVTAILGGHGHREETTLDLPVDGSGSKNAVQAIGSSTSYGKRYTAGLLLNLTSRGQDDDGKAAGTSEIVQRAMADINLAETSADLRAWRVKTYDGLSKIVEPAELREIIALYNRRLTNTKASESAKAGDRSND